MPRLLALLGWVAIGVAIFFAHGARHHALRAERDVARAPALLQRPFAAAHRAHLRDRSDVHVAISPLGQVRDALDRRSHVLDPATVVAPLDDHFGAVDLRGVQA